MKGLTLCLIPFILMPATWVSAEDKPVITVKFVLDEPTYKREFEDEERARLESRVTKELVENLSKKIKFVDFRATPSSPSTLTFSLNRLDPNEPGENLKEVGFHITLESPDLAGSRRDYLRFRPKDAWGDKVGSEEELFAEIRTRFLDGEHRRVARSLLSEISIAGTGRVIIQPFLAWIIPFKQPELCMDLGSSLKIKNDIKTAVGTIEAEYIARALAVYDPPGEEAMEDLRERILSRPAGNQEDLDILESASPDRIVITAIYVTDYHFSETICPESIPPSALFSGTEEGELP